MKIRIYVSGSSSVEIQVSLQFPIVTINNEVTASMNIHVG